MTTFAKLTLLLGDLFVLNAAIISSFYISGNSPGIESNTVHLIAFSNLTWFFLVLVSNPYNINKGWSLSKILRSQIAFIFIHLLVVISLVLFLKRAYSPLQLGIMYGVFVTFFFGWKLATYYTRKVFTPDVPEKNYILLGRNQISGDIRKYYAVTPNSGYRFIKQFDVKNKAFDFDSLLQFCNDNEVHEIICCVSDLKFGEFQKLIEFGLNSLIKVRIVVGSGLPGSSPINFDQFDTQPGFNLAVIPLDEVRNQFFKRAFDLIFSSLFITFIASWLFPIIAIIIKLDSKGPTFFRQLRSGKGNQPFNCLKFRSMKVNVEANEKQATKDDPRITALGAFLRKSSIDELPQFINVLLGDMSVVGPRPHMLKHTEEYGKLIEKFMGRHYVKPGITGLAQCMGYRGETKTLADMENRVRLDRYYIENWSFWLDIKIIFLTVVSLIRGSDKAY